MYGYGVCKKIELSGNVQGQISIAVWRALDLHKKNGKAYELIYHDRPMRRTGLLQA